MDDTLELSAIAPEHTKVNLRWADDAGQQELICELAERRDFGLLEYAHMTRIANELDEIERQEKPSSAKVARYSKLINDLAQKLIVGAPDAVIHQLPEAVKADVIQRFFMLAQAEKLAVVAHFPSENLSPDSSDSTEEIPDDG